jgi:hypothetical protein
MAEMERACHCTGSDIQAIYKITLFFAIFCRLFFTHLAHPPGSLVQTWNRVKDRAEKLELPVQLRPGHLPHT